MKSLYLSLLSIAVFGWATAQTNPDSVWITPAHPQPGQTVRISFHSDSSLFTKARTLDGGLYSFNQKNAIKAIDISLHKKGNTWTTDAVLPDTSVAVAVSISTPSGNIYKSVVLGLSGSDGAPLKESYNALQLIYSGFGSYLFGIQADKEKSNVNRDLYYQGGNPTLLTLSDKVAYYYTYKKDTVGTLALFSDLPLDSGATEADYTLAIRMLGRMKNKPLSDILTNLRKIKYPEGEWKKMEYLSKMQQEKDPAKMEDILVSYKKAFPQEDTASGSGYFAYLKESIASNYAGKGDLPNATRFVPAGLKGEQIAQLYNNIAWETCLKDQYLPAATALSKASLDTLTALETSGRGKPDYFTTVQYVKNIKSSYAMFADTYAYLLYKTGDFNQAFVYEKLSMSNSPDPETDIVERYLMMMEKVDKPAKVLALLSTYIEKGKSDSAMESQYKRLYTGSQSPDDALAALESKAKASKQAEMVKTILHEPASTFTLTDLDGNKVSLNDLKGKTVILDFWATWCGPCKASFPAMQKIVDKHKADKNVVVLFVDTWETADDKKKNAGDFIRQSPYTFHVLLDLDSKVVESYNVTGIPTKFIIDKNGILRFKAVGFDGNVQSTVDELESMIDLAGKE